MKASGEGQRNKAGRRGIFDVGSPDPRGFGGPGAGVQKETGGACGGVSLALASRARPEGAALLSAPRPGEEDLARLLTEDEI